MSAKGGSNTVMGDIGEFLTDSAWTLGTAGTMRINHDTDEVEKGYLMKALDEGVGEMSGRNMTREEIYKSDKRLEDERKRLEQLRKDNEAKNFANDVAASTAAESARGGSKAGKGQRNMSWKSPDETDFLGL